MPNSAHRPVQYHLDRSFASTYSSKGGPVLTRLHREQNDAAAQTQQAGFDQLDQTLQIFIRNLADQQRHITDHITNEHIVTQEVVRSEHLQTRSQLHHQFESLKLNENQSELNARLLASLRFDSIFARQNQVSEPAFDTFNWVFESQSRSSWPSLTEWLVDGNGPFRIQGKAGSGKSTLMRFILEHEKTKEILQIRAPQNRPKLISHFFWRAGSPAQSSLKGFLCSILYQMLEDESFLLEWTFRQRPMLTKKYNTSDWNNKQLTEILLDLLHNNPQSTSYLILVDGLDEFHDKDHPDDLLELLDKLFAMTNIKICVAHRPEPGLERFLRHTRPLRLQDLTYTDISVYTKTRFLKMVDMLECDIDVDSLDELVSEITSRSDGVFLWVRLVMEDIARGLKSHDTLNDLRRRLLRLPTDIERLYENMLERLGEDWQIYRKEAAFYLKACYLNTIHQSWAQDGGFNRRSGVGGELSVLSVSLAFDDHNQSPTDVIESAEHVKSLGLRCKRLQSRIELCCSGLLEIHFNRYQMRDSSRSTDATGSNSVPDAATFQATNVYFTHRTVFDFFKTPTGTSILAESSVENGQIFLSVIQAYLMFRPFTDEISYSAHFDRVISHIALGTYKGSYDPQTIWLALLMVERSFTPSHDSRHLKGGLEKRRELQFAYFQKDYIYCDFTGFALSHGLDEAFTHRFKNFIEDEASHTKRLNPAYANHLLDCALSRELDYAEYKDWPYVKWRYLFAWRPLVEAGADLNAEILSHEPWIKGYISRAPWTRFLETDGVTFSVCGPGMVQELLQHGTRPGQRTLVAVSVLPDIPYIDLKPVKSTWSAMGSLPYSIICEVDNNLLLRARLGQSSSRSLIGLDMIPNKLRLKSRPLLMIRVHQFAIRGQRLSSSEDEEESSSDDDDECTVEYDAEESDWGGGLCNALVAVIEPNESCNRFLAVMEKYEAYMMNGQNEDGEEDLTISPSEMDLLCQEVKQIYRRSRKTRLRRWMIEEGRLLPYDHPDAPKGPYKQFIDITDEPQPSATIP